MSSSPSSEKKQTTKSPAKPIKGPKGAAHPPIPSNLDYGIIGNGSSCALVSSKGQIDWCCLPHFDSASVFASLLDPDRGGSFGIEPVGPCEISQRYVTRTNVLVTTFTAELYKFEIIDFMPRYRLAHGEMHCPPDVIRLIKVLSGKPKVKIKYDPRPDYAKEKSINTFGEDYIKTASEKGSHESVYLYSNLAHSEIVSGEETFLTDESYFVFSYNQKIHSPNYHSSELEYERTKVYWLNWVSGSQGFDEYRDEITRSALTLKLLCYEHTGAILAAATTSLPETIGEERNWEYRFCWIRDASMTVRTLVRLGQKDTAKKFLRFILRIIPYKDEEVQIMYGIHGQKLLTEKELPWLSGYGGSQPVRIGNAAYHQKQNDIYGILLDTIEQGLRIFDNDISTQEHLWTVVRSIVRHVEGNWESPDMGIWEFRSHKRHFTFSKVLCWVAMDRAVRIASLLRKHDQALRWRETRDLIKIDVLKKGWNENIQAYTQVYGSSDLDASSLLMEPYGFISADDPTYISTVRQTYEKLTVDGLTHRYLNEDDFGKPKSSFTICSFWMIRALHQIGEKDLARSLFDQLISYSNHLGLLSEDIDIQSKRLLGNFPQAYSHLALVDTALLLTGQERSLWGQGEARDHMSMDYM